MGPKHVWASSIFFEKKINQPKGSRQGKKRRCVFLVCCLGCVLLAATTICTYNVGHCTMGVRCTLVISGLVH
jgi:hypothetical protein